MGMLKKNKWYIRKSDGKKLYCYDLYITSNEAGYFSEDGSRKCIGALHTHEIILASALENLLIGYNHSRISLAMGKHRSYINTMIKQGVSDKLYNKIKDLVTIDWNSDKPLYVNDGKHVPFTIKPSSCKQDKHKEWLQSLMMKGCIEL